MIGLIQVADDHIHLILGKGMHGMNERWRHPEHDVKAEEHQQLESSKRATAGLLYNGKSMPADELSN